jgi:lipoyl-dependent peroxiredoxin
VKVLYTAEATVTGGRDEGHARSADPALDVQLRTPAELGGPGGGTNPEQLFAAGYAACFESALKTVARRRDVNADDVSIASKVSLGPGDDRNFILAVALDVTLPQRSAARTRPSSCAPPTRCARTRTRRGATSTSR